MQSLCQATTCFGLSCVLYAGGRSRCTTLYTICSLRFIRMTACQEVSRSCCSILFKYGNIFICLDISSTMFERKWSHIIIKIVFDVKSKASYWIWRQGECLKAAVQSICTVSETFTGIADRNHFHDHVTLLFQEMAAPFAK